MVEQVFYLNSVEISVFDARISIPFQNALVAKYIIIERQFSIVYQLKNGNGGNQFGHTTNSEQVVRLYGQLLFLIGIAKALGVHQLFIFDHRYGSTCQSEAAHHTVYHRIDRLQRGKVRIGIGEGSPLFFRGRKLFVFSISILKCCDQNQYTKNENDGNELPDLTHEF